MYGDVNIHPLVRSIRADYLRLNPKRSTEFHPDNSQLVDLCKSVV